MNSTLKADLDLILKMSPALSFNLEGYAAALGATFYTAQNLLSEGKDEYAAYLIKNLPLEEMEENMQKGKPDFTISAMAD